MKSRSHRLPVSEPHHDDWVDGSWTVDCLCGVNYDDGEEMVDCDECGVWVHTRCSRYVKSEKSFSCDKCKNKKSSGGAGDVSGVRNDSEETEVAEFLVELPTKTLRMDNPNPPVAVTSRRPFRLWTDLPMEDRVHVQGVPGGEPGLFSGSGMSSVFGRELWKSTGYVPKKFNFRYNEFPLDNGTVEEKKEKELDKARSEENASQTDNGAGVLFSLLKENDKILPAQVVKSPVEGSGCHEVVFLRQKKNLDGENLDTSCPEGSTKKETSSVPIVLHSGKRKKEEIGMLKDQSVKKKVRTVEKDGDFKKWSASASKAASTVSSDAKHLESSQDGGSKVVNIHCGQNVINRLSDALGECATNLASNEHGLEATLGNDVSSDEVSRGGNREDHVPVGPDNFCKTNKVVDSITRLNGSLSTPVKEEVSRDTLQTREDVGGTGNAETGSHDKEPVAVEVKIASPDAKECQHGQISDIDEANSCPNKKLKGKLDADDLRHHHVESSPVNDVKLETVKATTQYPNSSVNVFSEEAKVKETSVISSETSNPKVLDATRMLTVGSSRSDKSDESPGNARQYKQQPTGEGSTGAQKKSSGLKYGLEVDEVHKSNGTARSHSTASYQRKAVSVVRSTSTSGVVKSTSTSGVNICKTSDNHTAPIGQNPSLHSRQNELSESSVATVKDNASADVVDREGKSGRPKKLVKEYSRHLPKISESTKYSHTSDLKKPSSESKGSSLHSSSKVPLMPNVALNRVSGECTSPPQMENASNMQKPGKVEKQYQSGNPPSSRGTVASMTAATSANVPATLSDEELALLLHQELNSSPRVPRVPRMRHAGSLPQITGPSATSMLMKRTSSGGKDHSVACRRRTKDFSGEGLHGSLEVDNEVKKRERKPSSPDNRRRDSGYSVDSLSKREADGPAKSVHSMKKTNMGSSLSSSADANGHNLSSSRPSSRTASGDDPRMFGHSANRTLPGLIAEIMSEGKRMTYQELCNLVLPHWPHLRKHNGERYAYSSHSQAVLDCLRNRSEWARLVDRGPKTSSSRKRRKLDADSISIDSEDNEEENRVKNTKDSGSKSFESHQEDFPKGKRKARKRRRLALQGRGIVRRRRRADVVSDDESESFSTSSEDSSSSEEEIQGGGTSVAGSEASASSDEV